MEAVIEQAILEHYEHLYHLAFGYVRNQQDALDIVQEAVYKAMKNHKKLKQKEFVKSWLWKITRNTALDFLQKQKYCTEPLEEISLASEDHYLDTDLLDALGHLNEAERTIIVLRYFEDFKLEQIAEIMNENINSIKSKLYRGLKKMKHELEMETIL